MKTLASCNHITESVSHAEPIGAGQSLLSLGNTLKLACAAAALLMGALLEAKASDPTGVYAFVDKIVFEPNDTAPERVQVWGGFTLATGRGDNYDPAKRGYMYFKLRTGEEDICRKEWADLKSVAGTGQIVAFGARWDKNGTVRLADAKAENADTYPKGWGMKKIKTHNYSPLNQLVALMEKDKEKKSPPKSTAVPATKPAAAAAKP